MNTYIAIGLLIPFLGTLIGASFVYLLRGSMSDNIRKLLLGFASGVMIAASVWSLLIPSMEMSQEHHAIPWLPTSIGFVLGMLFLLALDTFTPHLHLNTTHAEGMKSSWKRSTLLAMTVTLHNIPEGMAVGVVLASTVAQGIDISMSAALALSLGIALQNLPEGAIISMPLHSEGVSKNKAFGLGALSGVVEPIAGLLTIALITWISPILPYLLAFSAGAMVYVVVEELIPESQSEPHSNIATIGFMVGFVIMMIMDTALAG